MGIYLVESNFFIQAHRVSYPLDVAFSFWNKVKQLAEEGKIISIDKVRNEIYHNNDTLEEWCRANLPDDFFKESSEAMAAYGQVVDWAISRSSHYMPNALNEFLDADEADAFIVAYALADTNNRIVVTQEISEPNRKKKIKIPKAFNAFIIQFINTIEMFRQMKVTV